MQLLKKSFDTNDFLKFPRFLSAFHQTPPESKNFPHTTKINQITFIQSSHQSLSPPNEFLPKSFTTSLKNSKRKPTNILEVQHIHAQTIKTNFGETEKVGTVILDGYLKCRDLDSAHRLFEDIPHRNVRTWTILIAGCARMGLSDMAIDLFYHMQAEGTQANCFTLASVLKCCTDVNDLEIGKQLHGWILRHEIPSDVVLENAIVHFYGKSGFFNYAKRVFDRMMKRDMVSWNIMIGAYLQTGDMDGSVELFKRLPHRDVASWNTIIAGHMQNGFDRMALELLYQMGQIGAKFNEITFSVALLLASTLSLLKVGRQIHCQLLRRGFDSDTFAMDSLIDMYRKCGKMEDASSIFSKMHWSSKPVHISPVLNSSLTRNVITCSSMIAGYVQNGRGEDALKLLSEMLYEGFDVDPCVLTSLASACADSGILQQGKQIHCLIEKSGHKFDAYMASAVIDMYAKCGSVGDARAIFERTTDRSVVSWTSIIAGCALHGLGKEAIQLFELMLKDNINPNEITFVGVLSACSHAGLVEEGRGYFRSMQEDHGIVPGIEHFNCMVDLLGRAGYLKEAAEFIQKKAISHMGVVWRTLLSACRVHKNIEMGEWASKQLIKLEPFSAGSYILLSNICSTMQRWDKAAEVRNLMQERGVKKQPGLSWIQLKNKVHTFTMGDRSHPETAEIYFYLEMLIGKLKAIGYSTETNLVMQNVEEEQKEVLLSFHSEKLAVAYGLMRTACGLPIHVMKNLRICSDCHSAVKCMSQVTGREIIVRDAHRFHHFKNGQCSCRDYW